MGRFAQFGTALALGGALAMAASGCGSSAPTAKSVAIQTVRSYVGPILVGKIGDFKAQRQSNGDWKVIFSGRFTVTGKGSEAFIAACKAHPGQKASVPVLLSGGELVGRNGKQLLGAVPGTTAGKTIEVACPAS